LKKNSNHSENFNEVAERFRHFIDTHSKGPNDFGYKILGSKKMGERIRYLYYKESIPTTEVICHIIRRFDNFNLDWLFRGEGEMLENRNENSQNVLNDVDMEYVKSDVSETSDIESLKEIKFLVWKLRKCHEKLKQHGIE
jgi:hypothetical protein